MTTIKFQPYYEQSEKTYFDQYDDINMKEKAIQQNQSKNDDFHKRLYQHSYARKAVDKSKWNLKGTESFKQVYYDVDESMAITNNTWIYKRISSISQSQLFQQQYNDNNEVIEEEIFDHSILDGANILFSCLVVRRKYEGNYSRVSKKRKGNRPSRVVLYEDFIEYQDGDQHCVQTISCSHRVKFDHLMKDLKACKIYYQARSMHIEGLFRYNTNLYSKITNTLIVKDPFVLPDEKYVSFGITDLVDFPLHKDSKRHSYLTLKEQRHILIRKKGTIHLFQGENMAKTRQMINDACVS